MNISPIWNPITRPKPPTNSGWKIRSGIFMAGKVRDELYPVSFALLLNLVSASNAHNRDVLWGNIRAYAPDASPAANPGLDRLVGYALRYYDDFVKPAKVFRAPDAKERAALEDLAVRLDQLGDERD